MSKLVLIGVQAWLNGNRVLVQYSKGVEDYAIKKFTENVSSTLPTLIETNHIKMPSTGEQYDSEEWLVPISQIDFFNDVFGQWQSSPSPLPFATHLYMSLIDGATQLVSAIDPDGVLTSDFLAWLDSNKDGKNA